MADDRAPFATDQQALPSPQLRAQSISDIEHFPIAGSANAVPVGPSIEQISQELNETIGSCACGIEPFSRQATRGPIGQTSFKDQRGQRFSVSVVGYEFALKVHKVMAKGFGPSESLDGCYARAHRMAYVLEKHGVLTGKITALGTFRLKDKKSARGYTSWRYHLAPIIAVNDGATVTAWVLDPALFNEPVPVQVWLALLLQRKGSVLKEAYFTSRFVYNPVKVPTTTGRWDSGDLADAKKTLKKLARINRIRRSKGLRRLELAGLELALPPGLKWSELARPATPKRPLRTSDTSKDDTQSGRSSPETFSRPLASSPPKVPDFPKEQSTPNL